MKNFRQLCTVFLKKVSKSSKMSQESTSSSEEETEDQVDADVDVDGEPLVQNITTELERHVYELCESAYADGLSAEEIHRALHSFEKDPAEGYHYYEQNGRDKQSESCNDSQGNLRNLWRWVKNGVFVTTVTVLMAVVGYFSVCVAFDINPLAVFPSLQEMRCLVPTHPIIQEMVRPIANCSVCEPFHSGTRKGGMSMSPVIELDKVPTKAEFRKIAYLSKPIIVRRGAAASNVEEFNFARLKEIFESEDGGVDTVTQECQFLPFRSPFSSLREAFDLISSDSGVWERPWYIGWSNCHPGVASKRRELFPRPEFITEYSESSAIDWIFIGSPGLGAAMHVDYVKRPSWQAQLSGVKTWYLRPPPECEEACPSTVVFTLRPGDLLFLETNLWYHQTHIEGQQLSISIGSEYD